MRSTIAALNFLAIVSSSLAFSNGVEKTLNPMRAEQGVEVLDDDAIWNQFPASTLDYSILDNSSPRFRTEYKIQYDYEHLYIEITAYDREPTEVRQHFTLRDKPLYEDDDRVSVLIDPSGEKKGGQLFGVTRSCVIFDGISDEVNNFFDEAPQFRFQVKCFEQADYWRVRLKIPFYELRYTQSPTLMGFLIQRAFLRENNGILSSENYGYYSLCRLCVAQQVLIMAPPKEARIKATIELLSGEIHQNSDIKRRGQFGVTVSIPIDPATSLDGTYNPDFSQVESDVPYLSANSPFPVPRLEQRPFFMEGSDVLTTPFFMAAQSRAIVAPLYGLKLLQRKDSHKFIVLAANDRSEVYRLEPGSYASRYVSAGDDSRNLIARGMTNFSDKLTVGVLANFKDEGAHRNEVYGPDLVWTLNSNSRVYAQTLISKTVDLSKADPNTAPQSEKKLTQVGNASGLGYDYTNDISQLSLRLQQINSEFSNDLGFMPENGVRSAEVYASFNPQLRNKDLALSNLLLNASAFEKFDESRQFVINTLRSMDLTYETDRWVNFRYMWTPSSQVRVGPESPIHLEHFQSVSVRIQPPRYVTLMECIYQFGEMVVYSEDKLASNHKTTCRAKLNLGLRSSIEYQQDSDRYRVPETGFRLNDSSHRAVFYYFLSHKTFLRVTGQQTLTKRLNDKSASTDLAWLLGHQSPSGVSYYLGMTDSKENVTVKTKEYFAKVSFQF